MKNIVIIGAGGFAREVVWLINRINKVYPTWNILGYLDDNLKQKGKVLLGYPVLGELDLSIKLSNNDTYFICAVGAAKIRKEIINKLGDIKYAKLIDPSVQIDDTIKIGDGSIICAGNILTVDITIGEHVIINLDCTIGHDAIINDFVTVYPSVNISGNTNIGTMVEMGTGSKVIQGLSIHRETIIGAGGVIVKDISESGVYVGVPAKKKY